MAETLSLEEFQLIGEALLVDSLAAIQAREYTFPSRAQISAYFASSLVMKIASLLGSKTGAGVCDGQEICSSEVINPFSEKLKFENTHSKEALFKSLTTTTNVLQIVSQIYEDPNDLDGRRTSMQELP